MTPLSQPSLMDEIADQRPLHVVPPLPVEVEKEPLGSHSTNLTRNMIRAGIIAALFSIPTIAWNMHPNNSTHIETKVEKLSHTIMKYIIERLNTPATLTIYELFLSKYNEGVLDSSQQLANLLDRVCSNNDCARSPALQQASQLANHLVSCESEKDLQNLLLSLQN